MKLSARIRYGARALVEPALAYPDTAVSVKDAAERQNISPKYLEQIMHILKAVGLVKAVRGMHGGCALSRPPVKILLGDLFEPLEGSSAPVECVDYTDTCPMQDICPTRGTWVEMKECIKTFLQKTTLQDLAERKTRKVDCLTPMCYI